MRRQQSEAAAAAQVPDLLRLFLPALCHLTADDRARYVLLMLDSDQTLIEYFHHRYGDESTSITGTELGGRGRGIRRS